MVRGVSAILPHASRYWPFLSSQKVLIRTLLGEGELACWLMDWLSACQIIVFPIALDIIGFHLNYQLLCFYFSCGLQELILTLNHKGHGLFCINLTGEGGALLLLVTGICREAPSVLPWPLSTRFLDRHVSKTKMQQTLQSTPALQCSVQGNFQESWPSPCCIQFHMDFEVFSPVILMFSCFQRGPGVPQHL